MSQESDDLTDLCFLLDEERYQMHQLAEQWKDFGTTSIDKLESHIVEYQEKLTDLEQRQILLLKENDLLRSQFNQMIISSNTIINSSRDVSTQTYIDDSLQQQISLQNMFDAIKTVEVYESIENLTGKEEVVLKDFCNLIWKYLEERSKPRSSCLL